MHFAQAAGLIAKELLIWFGRLKLGHFGAPLETTECLCESSGAGMETCTAQAHRRVKFRAEPEMAQALYLDIRDC